MKKSLIALAFGTLALGIAEFVIMGILPDIASDLHVSIAEAGHLISAYALGVCVGAPMLILARKHPLKRILLVLVAVIMAGNVCAALAPNFWTLMAARFVSGLPHGAYFGVGSIAAEKLADKGKGSEAVSIMIAGMTIANLLGVPLGTALSSMLSWRVTFLLVGCWGMIVLYYIWRWIPPVENLPDTGFRGQFRFLRSPAPWLLIFATMLGNGGVFCWYSYVSPMLVHVSGFSPDRLTLLMMLAGFGMVVGNLTGGRRPVHSGPGRRRFAGIDLRNLAVAVLHRTYGLARRTADVSVHRRTVRRIEPAANSVDPLLQRRRNARRRKRAGSIQSRKRHRSLLRRIAAGSGIGIPVSGFGRSAFRPGRFRPADRIPPQIRTESVNRAEDEKSVFGMCL